MNNNEEYKKWLMSIGATKPKEVDGINNKSFWYHYNKLYKLLCAIIKVKGNKYTKDSWDIPYIKETLLLNGLLAVTDTSAGIVPLECGYYGINIYGHATNFRIANPVLGNLEGEINKDGAIIYLEHFLKNYVSLDPLLTRYAELLAQVDASINTTLINSRVAQVFYADSEAQKKVMEKMYDQVTAGKPAVFIRKGKDTAKPEYGLLNNVKNTFIGQELLDVQRTIINQFLTEIGINNSNTDKRERLITDEVNSNNCELYANIYEWDINLKECTKKAIELYPELEGIEIGINYDVIHNLETEYIEQPDEKEDIKNA